MDVMLYLRHLSTNTFSEVYVGKLENNQTHTQYNESGGEFGWQLKKK